MRRASDDPTAKAGRLYDEYGESLYRYAVMLLADPDAAEDAVHQVFASMLKIGPAKIQQDSHYLRRAVRNECYSMLRKRAAEGEARAPERDGIGRRRDFLDCRSGLIGRPEERMAVQDALRSLPPEQREVVHLHVYEGLTFQEIADASSESINTIASRYRYALSRLREHLR